MAITEPARLSVRPSTSKKTAAPQPISIPPCPPSLAQSSCSTGTEPVLAVSSDVFFVGQRGETPERLSVSAHPLISRAGWLVLFRDSPVFSSRATPLPDNQHHVQKQTGPSVNPGSGTTHLSSLCVYHHTFYSVHVSLVTSDAAPVPDVQSDMNLCQIDQV